MKLYFESLSAPKGDWGAFAPMLFKSIIGLIDLKRLKLKGFS